MLIFSLSQLNAQICPSISYSFDTEDLSTVTAEIDIDVSNPLTGTSYVGYVTMEIYFDAENGFDIDDVDITGTSPTYNYNSSTGKLTIGVYPNGNESLYDLFNNGAFATIYISGPANSCFESTSSDMIYTYNTDGSSTYIYCSNAFTLDDIDECFTACTSSSISGQVTLYDGNGVSGINIWLYDEYDNYLTNTNTNSSGNYTFSGLCPGSSYQVYVYENTTGTCGLSATDSDLLQQQILGNAPTDIYYHMQGDINESGSVTATDVVELNRKMLGVSTLNINWMRFTTQEHIDYCNTYNIDEAYDWSGLLDADAGSTDADFHLADVGDMNKSCLSTSRSEKWYQEVNSISCIIKQVGDNRIEVKLNGDLFRSVNMKFNTLGNAIVQFSSDDDILHVHNRNELFIINDNLDYLNKNNGTIEFKLRFNSTITSLDNLVDFYESYFYDAMTNTKFKISDYNFSKTTLSAQSIKDIVIVNIDDPDIYDRMVMYDLNGRQVYSSKRISQEMSIPIHNDMVQGIYFISLTGAEGILTEKIFINQ